MAPTRYTLSPTGYEVVPTRCRPRDNCIFPRPRDMHPRDIDVTHGIYLELTGYVMLSTGCHPRHNVTHGICSWYPRDMDTPTGYMCYPRDMSYPRDIQVYPVGNTLYLVGTCHPRDMLSRGEHPVVTHEIHPRDKNVTHGIHPRDKVIFIPWVLSRG